jgi:hypothetical protein
MARMPRMRKAESSGHSFPGQFGILEVQQKGQPEASDVEIADHLGNVHVMKPRHDFGVDNHELIDNQIGDEGSDVLPVVEHWKFALLLNPVSTLAQFNDKRPFVELLIQTRIQSIQHVDRRPDDRRTQVFVN